ncbi:unnamed protein product [Didymodactylos carnosus]|uniref:Coiled-coil domain-containing protein 103 n=1 Tax=Didymodactylos carnosus TaxID=1234261 RepID=A0A814DZC8_9BILA|nr:unnamed protein product [Didymodactylos carnosus]CAF0959198.1 unnamed protein product [Didymodactylos carnosus]CAF3683477.1 unnamed protein product [Didymodactylos carnosus]CAF3733971.1 unnamed protein product [Didymodactylos carnosus]
MTSSSVNINFRKLAENFSKEKQAETVYWQRNSAKFRAIEQRCASYDEFRQIVAASHLKPLDKNETLTFEHYKQVSWNQQAARQDSASATTLPAITTATSPIQSKTFVHLPKYLPEFILQWRRCQTSAMKFEYLKQYDLSTLEKIFQTDFTTELLNDLTQIYESNSYDNAQIIVQLLAIIVNAKRFQLTKGFFTEIEKHNLDKLFSHLMTFITLRPTVLILSILYLK